MMMILIITIIIIATKLGMNFNELNYNQHKNPLLFHLFYLDFTILSFTVIIATTTIKEQS